MVSSFFVDCSSASSLTKAPVSFSLTGAGVFGRVNLVSNLAARPHLSTPQVSETGKWQSGSRLRSRLRVEARRRRSRWRILPSNVLLEPSRAPVMF
jgi:hypothetical protein